MTNARHYSTPPTSAKQFLEVKKTRLSAAIMLLGGAALASANTQAATIGFIPLDPSRSAPTGTFRHTISSPDSAIVNIGVRLASDNENWQSSCTIRGKLVARGRPSMEPSVAQENVNYRLLSSTSFSLTTIPGLDNSGSFEAVDQEVLFEAVPYPQTEGDVSVTFGIEDLQATCGDVDVTEDLSIAPLHNYGGTITIADGFNQSSYAESEDRTFIAADVGSDLGIDTKI